MIITPDILPDWDSKDARFLEDFLGAATGRKLLGVLAFQAPELLDGSDVNKTLVASGVVKGYNRAVESLFSLTKIQPQAVPTVPSAYPPLDDERAWDDGH